MRRESSKVPDQAKAGMLAATAICVLTAILSAGAAASEPAVASTRVRHVVLVSHDKQLSTRMLARGARALTLQANQDLRAYWAGPPVLVKTTTSTKRARRARWRLTVAAANVNADESGIHEHNRHGVWAVVYPSSGIAWTWSASHELLEMLEDPTRTMTSEGFQREICDPVANVGYYIDGVVVSDFVTPAYFEVGSKGPWDYLSWLKAAPPPVLR
jgi:hypothetical protein